MSTIYVTTCRDASHQLNDWLCAQVSNVNSFEALENKAKEHSAYKDDAATMRIVCKVWCDYRDGKINPRGHVTEFERRLLLRTDPRHGADAIVLLMELRCHWRLTDKFPLSARAKNRGVVPEILRKPFDGAVKLLMATGCIQKVRPSRWSGDGKHDAALYGLTAVRHNGELPTIEKKTAQEPARKPQKPTEQLLDSHQKEKPPASPPEAPVRQVDEVVAARAQKLKTIIQHDADLREHAKWLVAHRKAELANKSYLVPEFIWEVWKGVFDYPVPMTQAEQTAIDNIAAEFKALGDETGMSAAELYEYLRMLRGPKVEDVAPVAVEREVIHEPRITFLLPADSPEPPVVVKEPEPVIVKKPEPIIFVAPPNAEEQAKLDFLNARNARVDLPPLTEKQTKAQLLHMREKKREAIRQSELMFPSQASKEDTFQDIKGPRRCEDAVDDDLGHDRGEHYEDYDDCERRVAA